MPKGQVKWFDPKKGYGFIVGPEGQDVFVHYSHIQAEGFKALKDGEWVDYELVQGDKGWQARNVNQSGESGGGSTGPRPGGGPGPTTGGPPRSAGYENPNLRSGDAPASPPPPSGYEGAEDKPPEQP